MAKKEIWNYRGSLIYEWNVRREAVGLTTDEAVKLGIETAEKEKAAREAEKAT